MFGFINNWLRRPRENPLERSSSAPVVLPRRSVSAIVEKSCTKPAAADDAGVLQLPMAEAIGRLPADLHSRLRQPLDAAATLTVPLATVIPQLSRGAVKISFAEFRRFAPEDAFTTQTDRDSTMIDLPLRNILEQLKPEQLPRRRQNVISLPTEVASPFAARGEGVKFYKPDVAAEIAARREVIASVEPVSAAKIAFVPPASPQNVAPVEAAARAGNGGTSVLPVALSLMSDGWPHLIREEIFHLGMMNSVASLPFSLVEEGLRRGRLSYTWKQMRLWASCSASVVSAHDSETLELPLKVIAPLFLAKQRGVRAAQIAAVDESIPNIFAGPAQTSTTAALAPDGHETRPASVPAGSGFPPSSPAKPPIKFGDTEFMGKARAAAGVPVSGTDFLRRYATPNDIVGKASSLDGVLGSLIVLPDGLLVASHLPPNVNADLLAAFTPQLYTRVAQSAREYRLGELKDLSLTVGNTNWKVFKVGSIFFAAFGNANETLPSAQLAQLAVELDRKKAA